MRLSSRKLKGVVLTTELVLLIIAIIIFAVIAFFGIAKTLIYQATSQKYTVMPVRAEAWRLASGIAGTIYVQNVGNDKVSVSTVGMKLSDGTSCSSSLSSKVTINPGEYKSFSVVCYASSPSSITSVYIYVSADGNEVGMAASVQSP